jgi:hypothetical protein
VESGGVKSKQGTNLHDYILRSLNIKRVVSVVEAKENKPLKLGGVQY